MRKSHAQTLTLGSGEGRVEQTRVLQGKTGVCGFGGKAKGTSPGNVVLSYSPVLQKSSFLSAARPSLWHHLRKCNSLNPTELASCWEVSCLGCSVEIQEDSEGVSDWVVWFGVGTIPPTFPGTWIELLPQGQLLARLSWILAVLSSQLLMAPPGQGLTRI